MRLKNLDMISVTLISALNVVWALLPNHVSAISIILVLPLVFVLPGYTLTEALFHRHSFNSSTRLLLSLGLSLTIDVLSGFILNIFPSGLQATSWAILLGLLTTVFAVLVVYRRRGTPVARARALQFHFSLSGYVLTGMAVLVLILSFLYAVFGATQQRYPGFTQLWMLPVIEDGNSCAVRLGVQSFETTPVTYRLTMSVNGTQFNTWSSVTLASRGKWERLVPITPTATNNVHVEVQLYRLDKPQSAYRSVASTLYSCAPSQANPNGYPVLAKAYTGTLYDIAIGRKTNISFTGLQQNQEKIAGFFRADEGPRSFNGSVTTAKQVQFMVIGEQKQTNLLLNGAVQENGTIVGNYCNLDQHNQCLSTYGYGIWSVNPASP